MENLLSVNESKALMSQLLEGKPVSVPVISDRHTEYCITTWASYLMSLQAFTNIFPLYCKKCGGTGALETRDSVPYGMGSCTMVGEEPCSCLEDEICPLCGQRDGWTEVENSLENPLSPKCKCGYDGSNLKLHAPTEFECYCYELESREMRAEFNILPSMDWLEQLLLAGNAPATDFVERSNDREEGF